MLSHSMKIWEKILWRSLGADITRGEEQLGFMQKGLLYFIDIG